MASVVHAANAATAKNNIRTVIMNRIVAGRSVPATVSDPGRHSILGRPVGSGRFSDLAVLDGDAALPTYIVCYTV